MNRALAAYKDVLERASALGIHYAIIRMPEQNTQVLDDLDVILFSADAPRFITFAGENGFSSAPSGSHIFLTKTHDGLPLKFDLHTKLKVGSKGAQIVGDQLDQLVSQAALRQGMYALPQTYEAALLL